MHPCTKTADLTFGNYFKAEVKTSGQKILAEEKLSISSKSDRSIHANVRAIPPVRVLLLTESISSPTFSAECTCSAFKKNQLCKHIWATLLQVEVDCPDFLSEKNIIEKAAPPSTANGGIHEARLSAAKTRASEYRKEQYQKHKNQVKARKRERSGRAPGLPTSIFPAEVHEALAYFNSNGFPMDEGPSEELLSEAKRKLSRVFHPDKGGSHAESVELNANVEVLIRFLRN